MQQIQIICDKSSPRLEYTCKILFGIILKVDYKIVSGQGNKPDPKNIAFIKYSSKDPDQNAVSIPAEDLLWEEHIRGGPPEILPRNMPGLSFSDKSFSGFDFDFDLFAAAFYLITEYESYRVHKYDKHGRHDEDSNELYKRNHHKQPLLHIYAEAISDKLSSRFPFLNKPETNAGYRITFDIDSPWLHRHKPLLVSTGGFIKDLLKADIKALSARLKSLGGSDDPYDTYDYIFSKVSPQNLLFFFLIDRHSKKDERYTYRNIYYRKLIRYIVSKGASIGIHPSYLAFHNKEMIAFEKQKLEDITGGEASRSRMHFLKYRLPETYQYLLACGITEDHTACMIHSTGFRHFMALPFPWFDLSANRETALQIYPAMVMDRSLQKYMNLSPEKAFQEIREMIDTTFRYKGVFSIIFHNSSLSEYKEWQGWREVFEKTVGYLQEKTAEK